MRGVFWIAVLPFFFFCPFIPFIPSLFRPGETRRSGHLLHNLPSGPPPCSASRNMIKENSDTPVHPCFPDILPSEMSGAVDIFGYMQGSPPCLPHPEPVGGQKGTAEQSERGVDGIPLSAGGLWKSSLPAGNPVKIILNKKNVSRPAGPGHPSGAR